MQHYALGASQHRRLVYGIKVSEFIATAAQEVLLDSLSRSKVKAELGVPLLA